MFLGGGLLGFWGGASSIGTRDVSSQLSIGASLPNLQTIAIAALGTGFLLLLLSGSTLYLVVRRRR